MRVFPVHEFDENYSTSTSENVYPFICRTRTSSGPKPIPLLPQNEDGSKVVHHMLYKSLLNTLIMFKGHPHEKIEATYS